MDLFTTISAYSNGRYENHRIRVPSLWAEDKLKRGLTHVGIEELSNGQLLVTPMTHDLVRLERTAQKRRNR